jgi:hypothetical protein
VRVRLTRHVRSMIPCWVFIVYSMVGAIDMAHGVP